MQYTCTGIIMCTVHVIVIYMYIILTCTVHVIVTITPDQSLSLISYHEDCITIYEYMYVL